MLVRDAVDRDGFQMLTAQFCVNGNAIRRRDAVVT
jgi:hypothetical protein